MDKLDHEDYMNYWETNMFFLQTDHQHVTDKWGLEEAFPGAYDEDSSSPDGAQSAASRNIASERKRRRNLNQRLFALRAVVPNITKMDKASIIKDAIKYIGELHEQEKKIKTEIVELEIFSHMKKSQTFNDSPEKSTSFLFTSKKRIHQPFRSSSSTSSSFPIDVIDLSVSHMGDKIAVVNLTCNKKSNTLVKICEVFESLRLNVITASITTFSDKILKTVFIKSGEEENESLKRRIEMAIAALSEPESPMSI